jgi:four helix bundle protein
MGRLKTETLERVERYADRVLDVVESIQKLRRSRRILDQMAGSGTSVGAKLFEADQAVSAKDFGKSLGIVVKELSETKFWLRLVARRQWVKPAGLAGLLQETDELLSIFNTVIVRTRSRARPSRISTP